MIHILRHLIRWTEIYFDKEQYIPLFPETLIYVSILLKVVFDFSGCIKKAQDYSFQDICSNTFFSKGQISGWLPLKHASFTFNCLKKRILPTLIHKAECVTCKRSQLWSWHFFSINEISAADEPQMANYAK